MRPRQELGGRSDLVRHQQARRRALHQEGRPPRPEAGGGGGGGRDRGDARLAARVRRGAPPRRPRGAAAGRRPVDVASRTPRETHRFGRRHLRRSPEGRAAAPRREGAADSAARAAGRRAARRRSQHSAGVHTRRNSCAILAQFADAPAPLQLFYSTCFKRRNGTELPPKAAQNKWLAHMVLNDGWKDTDYCSVRAVQAEFGLDAVRSPDERTRLVATPRSPHLSPPAHHPPVCRCARSQRTWQPSTARGSSAR